MLAEGGPDQRFPDPHPDAMLQELYRYRGDILRNSSDEEAWQRALPADARGLLLIGLGDGTRMVRAINSIQGPVIVFEQSVFELQHALTRFELQEAIQLGRVHFACHGAQGTAESAAASREQLKRVRAQLPDLPVRGGSPWWERVLSGENWPMDRYAGLTIALQEAFLGEYGFVPGVEAWSKRLAGLPAINADTRFRIWCSVGEGTSALETIFRKFCRAMEADGHTTRLLIERHGDEFSQRVRDIVHWQPDLILVPVFFAKLGLMWISELMHFPQGVILNNPQLHLERFAGKPENQPGPWEHAFARDQLQLDWVQQRFEVEGNILPLATSYDDHEPVAEADIRPVVAFIGNLSDPKGVLAALPRERLQALYELCWQMRPTNAMVDMAAFHREGCRIAGLAPESIIPLHLWSSIYRLAALEELAGLPLEIYGRPDWLKFTEPGPLAGCYRRHLEPERELPGVMARALINLNISTLANSGTANMRTYDATGLGCCLVQDRKPEAVQFFEHDAQVVFFDGRADLRSRVESLLANPARARAIGMAARRHVLQHHTWGQRARFVIDTLRTRFAGQRPALNASLVESLRG